MAQTALSLGRSCESMRPIGSRFELTTIRSSMLRSLKIWMASAAKASSRRQIGLRVMTLANV